MILVTGGNGFLGRHLVRRLVKQDAQVTVVDNGATNRRDRPEEGAGFVQADVIDDAWHEGLPDISAVYHLASPASPRDYGAMPVETLRTGAEGTHRMLELARRHDARFLLASTSEVYGDPEVHPQPESYAGRVPLTGPRAVYDEAKRYAEAMAYTYARRYSLDVGVARIFNTYGPGMRPEDGRVMSTFVHRALEGRPLPLYGDGSQTRSFCYVDDLIDGLVLLMQKGDARPVNLGNPEEVTIRALADVVHEVVGTDTGIQRRPLPQDDPTRRRPDITRARRLGWSPRTSLRDGVTRYVRSIRNPEVLA